MAHVAILRLAHAFVALILESANAPKAIARYALIARR
jgi:hypothetical protein